MYNNIKTIVTTIFILFFLNSIAQISSFTWGTESCKYLGYFDSTKVTREKLTDTYRLWFSNYTYFETKTIAFQPSDIEKLDLEKLEKEYYTKLNELKNLSLLNGEYWDSLRTIYINEIKYLYNLKKIAIQGYQNPKLLLNIICINNNAQKYALILNDTEDEIMKGWDYLLEEQCKKNGYPDNLRAKHAVMKNSKDSLIWAKIELMTFGWWNSANNCIEEIDKNRIRGEKLFESIFSSIKTVECDDTD